LDNKETEMKKIVLSLALISQIAFAYEPERVEYSLRGNYATKEACVLNHFAHIALLVDLKSNAKPIKDLDIEQLIKSEKEIVSYENDTQFIQHHIDYSGYYLVWNKKSKAKTLYKITEPSVVPLRDCIAFVPK
jgi:hypothetical protein